MTRERDKWKIDAVVFDFDGTLYDSFSGINKAFEESSKLVHQKKFSLLKSDIGPQLLELYENAFGKKVEEEFNIFQKHFRHYYDEVFYNHGEFYQGSLELLNALRKLKIRQFVVSNKPQQVLEKIITGNKIDNFFTYVSGHPFGGKTVSKKSERLIQLINDSSLDPISLLVLGDTKEDLQMAVEANCRFVHASYGYGTILEDCYSVSSPLEILNLIQHEDSRS